MATRYVCDKCGKDCESKNKVDYRVQFQSGHSAGYSFDYVSDRSKPTREPLPSILLDLCWECAEPVHKAIAAAIVANAPAVTERAVDAT
jgi:hypothetical protein